MGLALANTGLSGIVDGEEIPETIATLSLWLPKDGFTLDTPPNILTWNDLGPNAVSPTQSTGSLQPDRSATGINSAHPAADFDGSDDILKSAVNIGALGTCFFVIELATKIDKTTARQDPIRNAAQQGIKFGVSDPGVANEIVSIGSKSFWGHDTESIATGAHVIAVRWNSVAVQYDIYVDGGASKTTGVDSPPAVIVAMNGVDIGRTTPGPLGEFVVYTDAVSLVDFNRLGQWLDDRYGIGKWSTAT